MIGNRAPQLQAEAKWMPGACRHSDETTDRLTAGCSGRRLALLAAAAEAGR